MSHVVASKVIVTDLECLKRAIARFPKLKWMNNQKTFHWYGRWVNDYSKADAAYKLGIDVEDYGKCEHAIHMDNVSYEIGIMKRKDGKGYAVVWDFFSDGAYISDYLGAGAEKLMAAYQEEYLQTFAQSDYNSHWETTSEDDEWKTMELEVNES